MTELTAALHLQAKVMAMEAISSAIAAYSPDAASHAMDVEALGHAVCHPIAVKRVEETALWISSATVLLRW